MPWKNVENRADRASLARDAGLGQVSLISVLAGTLVAYGAFVVLLAITAAVARSVGFDTELSGADWRQLGVTGGIIVAAVLFLSYLLGGYVGGRMARRAGVVNGFLVFVLGVVVAVGVTGLVNLFTDGDAITANLRNVGVPTSGEEWGDIATVAGLGSLLAMAVGATFGGALGERWHGKLVTRALDPDVGPEAHARAEMADAAERRRGWERTREGTAVADRDADGGDRDTASRPPRSADEADRADADRAEADRERTAADDVRAAPPVHVEGGGQTRASDEDESWQAERDARARARDERARAAAEARNRPSGGSASRRRR